MRAFSYAWSFPSRNKDGWGVSHHSIRCSRKPHAACKPDGSIFYTLCLKKTSPMFLAITRKALSDFYNIWQKYYKESKQSKDAIFFYLT